MNNSENFNDCWAVFGKLGAEDYDDRRARVSVVGAFAYPCNAEDFIRLCIPAENRDRFRICRVSGLPQVREDIAAGMGESPKAYKPAF